MEFLGLTLLGLAGILLHVIMKFRDLITKTPKGTMSFNERLLVVWNKFDVLGNVTYGIFALIVVLVIVGVRSKIDAFFPVTYVTIIFVGYAADSAIKNLQKRNMN